MPPLMTTIANGTAQIIEVPVLIAASLLAFAAAKAPQKPTARKDGPVDAHTMSDIGVEPGRITWMG